MYVNYDVLVQVSKPHIVVFVIEQDCDGLPCCNRTGDIALPRPCKFQLSLNRDGPPICFPRRTGKALMRSGEMGERGVVCSKIRGGVR